MQRLYLKAMSIWQKLTPEAFCSHKTKQGKRKTGWKNQGILGDSSKSWGVPRLNLCTILAYQYGLNPCFLHTPLPSSVLPVHFTGGMLLKHSYVTPAALNCAAGAIPYRQKQSLLGRKGKKGTNEVKTKQRPRCHDMSSRVSKSLRSHPSFLFLKGDWCFKTEMERNVWSHYLMSAVQQLHTERCQRAEAEDGSSAGQREELQICPSGKQPTAHLPFNNKV